MQIKARRDALPIICCVTGAPTTGPRVSSRRRGHLGKASCPVRAWP